MRWLRLELIRAALCAFVVVWLAASANAQFKASIQGTVADTSGAVIPGATVKVTNNETGRTLQATTGSEGFYKISGLPPGRYKVTVEREGFKKKELQEVVISAEETQGVDIALEPGAVTDIVTISSETTPALQTESANVDRGITEREVRRLPQFGRDPYELVRLAPGVFGQGARSGNGGAVNLPNTTGPGGSATSVFQVENQVPVSANGQRLSNNNFQIDGVSVNSLGWGGAAVVTPNQESVKEIRVTSSSYSAEDGRNSGAQIKVVSQNGTNEFHGSGFFKYNDPGLNAFNKFGGTTGNPLINAPPVRVEQRFRQFGGSLGGPIYLPRFGEGGPAYFSGKNRLFFFFSYEGLRERSNNTFNFYSETPQFREMLKSLRPGGVTTQIINSAGIEPRIAQQLPADCSVYGANAATQCRVVAGGLDIGSFTGGLRQYVPAATGGGFDGVPDLMFAQFLNPRQLRGDQFNTRVDYNREKDAFAVSTYFTRRNDSSSDTAAQARPMADTNFQPLNSAVTLTYNRTISATLLNEARVNFTRFAFDQVTSSPDVNYGLPRVEVEGLPIPGRIRFGANRGETSPGIFAQNTYSFRDTLSWVNGAQAWKFGVEITREQNNNNLLGGARPLYSFVGLFNLANDAPIFQAINTDPANGRPANAQRYSRTGDYGFFAQNDWKVRPNLTLNLGVRYEYFTPLREKRGRLSNLVFGPNGLKDARVEVRERLFEPDRNNFAPRFGFAYSPKMFGDKMVWRGGFGIAYNRVPNVLYDNSRGNPPFFARNSICCASAANPFVNGTILYTLGASNSVLSYPVNPALARGLDPATNGVIGSTVEIYGTPPKVPNSYVYLFSLEGQYTLPLNLTATLGYQGSAGHKLERLVNQNFIFENSTFFNPVFFVTPDVNTNYHAMNARLQRRFAHGLQFDANYRWAKSIDTLSYGGPGFVTNQTFPQDLSTERGPSDFDTRHYFVMSGVWDLPIFSGRKDATGKILSGWQVSAIVTRNTGFPWTPVTARPALITPGGRRLSPIRPISYLGGALDDSSDEAFLRPGGNFPGGGEKFFVITGTAERPGIGRNSFRGPQYFSVDLALGKETVLPTAIGLGENARLDIRANFFNAFNQLNLQHIPFGSAGALIENPNFGRSPAGMAGRVIEFQARFSF
jgi:hypothetical protein